MRLAIMLWCRSLSSSMGQPLMPSSLYLSIQLRWSISKGKETSQPAGPIRAVACDHCCSFLFFFSFYLTEFWFSWRTFRWRGAGSTRPPSLWRPSAARGAPIAAVPPRSRPVRDSCATCWYLKPSKNSVTWIQKETIQKTNYLVRNCTEFYLVSRKGITGTVLKETRLLWVLGRSGWLAGSELPMSIQWGSRWTGSDDQRRIWRRNLASASGCQRKVTFKSSRRLAARTSWCTPHGSRPKPRHSKSASGTSWRR